MSGRGVSVQTCDTDPATDVPDLFLYGGERKPLVSEVSRHSPVVFVQAARKLMGSILAGHEIQIVCRGGLQSRLQGFHAGVTNGTGRETFDQVGVVGGVPHNIRLGDLAGKGPYTVDRRGITL